MTHPRTPPLRPDVDPEQATEYADRLAAAKTLKQMNQIHKEFADLREHRTLRDEISGLIRAPKGSAEAKARDKLGIFLILFGIFGVAILFWIFIAIASLIF